MSFDRRLFLGLGAAAGATTLLGTTSRRAAAKRRRRDDDSGDGDGPMSALLDPKPARHSDAAAMSALSDETLFRVIKDGGPAVGKSPQMAAWGDRLSDETIRDLVAYVRSLALNPLAAP